MREQREEDERERKSKEFPQDTTQQMSRRMQINPTTRRSKLCTYARMRQSLFQGFAARASGAALPPPTHSPRMPPQGTSLQRCNGAMRPTLQRSVHYRVRRVRRDPENRLLLRDPLRGITFLRRATRSNTTSLTRGSSVRATALHWRTPPHF